MYGYRAGLQYFDLTGRKNLLYRQHIHIYQNKLNSILCRFKLIIQILGVAFLGNSVNFGDQYRIRVAGPDYRGHCISWDYPLINTTTSHFDPNSGNNTGPLQTTSPPLPMLPSGNPGNKFG